MKLLRSLLLLFFALAVGGCRVRPEQRAILTQYEHDLRRYEDLIYDLEYEYEIVCSENERLHEKLAAVDSSHESTKRESPRLFRPQSSSPPTNKPKVKKEVMPEDDLTPPEIEAGPMTPLTPKVLTPEVPRTQLKDSTLPPVSPTLPNIKQPNIKQPNIFRPSVQTPSTTIEDAPPRLSTPSPSFSAPPVSEPIASPPIRSVPEESGSTSSLLNPAPVNMPANVPTAPVAPVAPEVLPSPREGRSTPRLPELLPEPSDKKVSQLRIDSQQTHGIDLDRHPGDDALHVVLQPLNAEGQLVPAAGKVSLVLLDPSKQGEEARVGRWEFDAEVVRYQFHLAKKQHIPLDLPWANGRPAGTQLSLFVRYEGVDGQKVDAHELVNLKLPSEGSMQTAWTPRTRHRHEEVRNAVANTKPETVQEKETQIKPAAHVEEAVATPEWKPYR